MSMTGVMAYTTSPKNNTGKLMNSRTHHTDLHSLAFAGKVIAFVTICTALYYGQGFIIPTVISCLLSFALAPIVFGLERMGFPRKVAAAITTFALFSILALIIWGIISEIVSVGVSSSVYAQTIGQKIQLLQHRIARQVYPIDANFKFPTEGWFLAGTSTVAPQLAFSLGVTAAISVVTAFFLIYREDLRDRLLRLFGEHNLLTSTKLFDEAGMRLSNYLSACFLNNLLYSICFGIILYLFEVPSALLWVTCVILLRFIPHVGVILSSLPPALLLFATTPGWESGLSLIATTIMLDLCFTNIVEPFVYGSRVGIATLPLLLATLFWIWMWGIAGLALATPITICLVVLGRVIPILSTLSILFDAASPLGEGDRICQRILADDLEGARNIWSEVIASHPNGEGIDLVALPALKLITTGGSHKLSPEVQNKLIDGFAQVTASNLFKQHSGNSKECILILYPPTKYGRFAAHLLRVTLQQDRYRTQSISIAKITRLDEISFQSKYRDISGYIVITAPHRTKRIANLLLRRLTILKPSRPVLVWDYGLEFLRNNVPHANSQRSYTYQVSWNSTFSSVINSLRGAKRQLGEKPSTIQAAALPTGDQIS